MLSNSFHAYVLLLDQYPSLPNFISPILAVPFKMQKNTKLPNVKGVKTLSSVSLLKRQWYDLNFIFNRNDNTTKALTLPSKTLKAPQNMSFSPRKVVAKKPSKLSYILFVCHQTVLVSIPITFP